MYVPNAINERPDDQQIRITSPAAFVASVPALLGFHPERSLVAALLEGARLVCTIRIDLDGALHDSVRVIVDAARNGGADRAVLALYASDAPETARELARRLDEALSDSGLHVLDVLQVRDGRFRSLMCEDPGCCPPQGTLIPPGTTELESEQVARGHLAIAPSREALAAHYAARPERVADHTVYREASTALAQSLASRCEQALSDLRLLVAATHRPDHRLVDQGPVEVARIRLTLLLDDVTVRDYLLATLASGPDDPAAVEALTQLALTATFEVQAAVAATAATAQACIGGSPVAIWSLLDLAPDNSLARLLTSAIHAGFTPAMIREVLTSALPEIEARITA